MRPGARPRRVAVVGSSGAGKSWLAARLAAALQLPWIELDAIHHGPGWTPLEAAEMRARLDALCPADGAWVADGNYEAEGGELVRARADLVVWLDLPRARVMAQLGRRTARRVLRRQVLWNGNRETLRAVLSRDPERSILLWAWTQHGPKRASLSAAQDARWVRVADRAGARRLLAELA